MVRREFNCMIRPQDDDGGPFRRSFVKGGFHLRDFFPEIKITDLTK